MRTKILCGLFASLCLLLASCPAHSQTTWNLRILFAKHTPWRSGWGIGFGTALAPLGDLNGDGYGDILVSVTTGNQWPGGAGPGWAEIYWGGSPMDTLPDIILRGEWYGDAYGISAVAGDFNGDSIPDIVIGASTGARLPDTTNCPGKVYIYYGRRPMRTTPDLILYGEEHAIEYGWSVAASDLNGDGYDDLAVGAYAWRWWSGQELTGRVYIYFGSPSGLSTTPNVILTGIIGSGESLGSQVSGGKDVNNDGYQDLVVGAMNNSENGWIAGKVYVYAGGNPMSTQPMAWIHGEVGGEWLGFYPVSLLSSLTGRPYGDVLCSSAEYQSPQGNGKVYLLYGGSPMDSIVDLFMIGPRDTTSGTGLGYSSSPGDNITGQGFGSVWASNVIEDSASGAVYLWLGSPAVDTVKDAAIYGRHYPGGLRDAMGCVVASAGDVDGDGRDELMVSNYSANPAESSEVWVLKYTVTGVEGESKITRPLPIYLRQNRPNPFKVSTEIEFLLSKEEPGDLAVFNAAGVRVKTIIQGRLSSGKHRATWDGRDDRGTLLPSGVYFVRLRLIGGFQQTRRMVLVR